MICHPDIISISDILVIKIILVIVIVSFLIIILVIYLKLWYCYNKTNFAKFHNHNSPLIIEN